MIAFLDGHDAAAPAIIDAATGTTLTRGALVEAVAHAAVRVRELADGGLVFHLVDNSTASIILYLACLEARCPVCLLEPGEATRMMPLVEAFSPDVILSPASNEDVPGYRIAEQIADSYRIAVAHTRVRRVIDSDLALLLTTSGSTGSRKLVRLTRANIEANARSIVEYLGIRRADRSAQTLPVHYSYGLSLVNSHLLAGAAIVLTPWSVVQAEFWGAFDATGCTSLAGVPFVYEMLHRLRFDLRRHPTLRTMTQAGGPLKPELAQAFHDRASAAEARFFVMYGQTEAAARIAYVPWERLADKIGSIGVSIPGGRLSLAPVDGVEADELVYSGPNVMQGYAERSEDLALGDVQNGQLRTGDLARVDDEGFHFLLGRLKRFAKLFGKRVNLEDVERDVEQAFPGMAAVVERNNGLRVVVVPRESVDRAAVVQHVAQSLRVSPTAIAVEIADEMPLTSTGKKDYQALKA